MAGALAKFAFNSPLTGESARPSPVLVAPVHPSRIDGDGTYSSTAANGHSNVHHLPPGGLSVPRNDL